jgi:hypothetical protein
MLLVLLRVVFGRFNMIFERPGAGGGEGEAWSDGTHWTDETGWSD